MDARHCRLLQELALSSLSMERSLVHKVVVLALHLRKG